MTKWQEALDCLKDLKIMCGTKIELDKFPEYEVVKQALIQAENCLGAKTKRLTTLGFSKIEDLMEKYEIEDISQLECALSIYYTLWHTKFEVDYDKNGNLVVETKEIKRGKQRI